MARLSCRRSPHVFTVLPTARHDGQVAHIKERCVDNAVGLDGQQRCRCARQPEMQSKVDVLGGLTATTAEATVQVEHQLNLARQIRKMATRIDRLFLAMSDPLFIVHMVFVEGASRYNGHKLDVPEVCCH